MKFILILFVVANINLLYSFNEKSVVAEIGNEKVTLGELKRAYEKNLSNKNEGLESLNKKEFNKFLNLYIDYKLKVLDAVDKGFLKDTNVINEINSNRELIAKSFYLDKVFESPRVNDIIEKRKNEFRFAYIIIPFTDDSSKSLSRISAFEALDKIKKGASFSTIAEQYSKDMKSAKNGGIVESWVTGGQMQKHLEIPLLSIKPGEVYPNVIETSYGFFIVKLLDFQPRKLYKGAHILAQFKGATKEDTTKAYEKINMVIEKLKNGSDFERLAKDYSDDLSTRDSGGVFSYWYSRSTGFENNGAPLVKSFDSAFIPLKINEVSGIVPTEYGLHLIKKNGEKDLDPIQELKKSKELFKKAYYTKDIKQFEDSLAQFFGYIMFDNIRDEFQQYIDTTKTNLGENWSDSIPESMLSKKLFAFNKKFYSISDFINISNTKKELKGFMLSDEGIELATKKIIEDDLYKLATKNLEQKYPEFALLSEEFKNGTILFKAEDLEVWKKNKLDSNIAKAYYDSTKSNYMTNWQYDLYEIFQFSDKNIQTTLKKLQSGEDFETLASLETQREGFREKKGYRGILDAGKDDLAKKIDPTKIKLNEVYGPIELERGFSLVKAIKINPPRVMTFEEAFPLISPKVLEISQNNLKNEWLKRVRTKHKVIINNKVINENFK